jgi:hypothetical protein
MESLRIESGPRARWFTVLCLTAILSTPLSGEEKKKQPAVQPTPAKNTLNLMVHQPPDLAVELQQGWGVSPYSGPPLYAIVKNVGQTKSRPSTLRVTCDRYKGGTKLEPCLTPITLGVKALEPGQAENAWSVFPHTVTTKCKEGEVTLCRI